MGMLAKLREKFVKILPDRFRRDVVVIPAVRLSGPIGMVNPVTGGMTIGSVATRLERAFDFAKAPAVAVIVNSPGGSPVQSRLIFERIRQLAEEKEKKVVVFIEDVGASGGYMIACAGDEIVADPSSIVGSIGVISSSFGFVDLLGKLGIERRVHTAGENKAILDPFSPEKPEDIEHLKALQLEIHETFIDLVRERRGSRLKHDEDLFTGLFWSGKRALGLGLVDHLGDLRAFLKERYGETVKIKLIAESRGLILRRSGGADGHAFAEQALGALEARALWARFGL